MPSRPRRTLTIAPATGGDPTIARWLWALGDTRQRTLALVVDLPTSVLDRAPPAGQNSIGTPLYHIAAIEAG